MGQKEDTEVSHPVNCHLHRRESDVVTTRKLTLVTSTIVTIVLFGRICIVTALEEVLKIFEGVHIKVALAMVHIILDVILGERIKKDDLGFFVVKCLFITALQEFDSM